MLLQNGFGDSSSLASPTISGDYVSSIATSEGPGGEYNSFVGAAISFLHKLRGMPDPMTSFLVAKFLHGLSNVNASQDVRLPITRPILHRMLRALSVMGFSLYKTTLLRAFFLTMFDAFLPIGEATSKSPASSPIQYCSGVMTQLYVQ